MPDQSLSEDDLGLILDLDESRKKAFAAYEKLK